MTSQMSALNPPGKRQVMVTTTIKNDPASLAAAHTAYRDGVAEIRHVKANDISCTLVLQPFVSAISWRAISPIPAVS